MSALAGLGALANLSFAAPWALGLLGLLPLLWLMLRLLPPRPRLVEFPAIRLLLGLRQGRDEALSAPPWLIALRLALAATLILAAARPVWESAPSAPAAEGALLLAVDDGWASARDWPARRAFLETQLARAGRENRAVLLLPTAPPPDGEAITPPQPITAAEAQARLAGLEPKPWATDRRAALKALPAAKLGRVVWLSDGLDGDGASDFARALQGLGAGLVLAQGRTGRQLQPPSDGAAADRLVPVIRRLERESERLAVRGLDQAGTVIVRGEAEAKAGQAEVAVELRLPVDLRNRLARIEIEGERSAAATLLLDQTWRRRSVGLAAGGAAGGAPLLDRLYYVERALGPHADLSRADPEALAAATGPDAVILADMPLPPGPLALALARKVEAGGLLIRFAGPLLAQGGLDPLLPVRLRSGGRALGGAMSWTTPQALAPFGPSSPFHGFDIPAEVTVASQVLAEPGLDLAERSWAALADGTPLVTAKPLGKGWIVLFHVTANAEWSNLPLSGLFVDMLRRTLALSAAGTGANGAGPKPPLEAMDGFGRLSPAGDAARPLEPGDRPGPRHPPGFYGKSGARTAFNLSPGLDAPRPLAAPPGANRVGLEEQRPSVDLGPALLILALLLAALDGLAALALSGLLRRAALILPLLLAAAPAQAEDKALEAGLATRLACLKTFDAAADADCLAGLRGLSRVLEQRTTAALAEPMAVDPARDPLAFHPLLYWRVSARQAQPSAAALDKLSQYMAHGGLLVIDLADEAEAAAGADTAELTRLRAMIRDLALPPLEPLAADHVLNRAFYLLKSAPGRWEGSGVWIARAEAGGAHDGVAPLILGGADWVGAWAMDERGRWLHPVSPGAERQRETALRFGVNLVLYALTGAYKADQAHLPAIMERLGR